MNNAVISIIWYCIINVSDFHIIFLVNYVYSTLYNQKLLNKHIGVGEILLTNVRKDLYQT